MSQKLAEKVLAFTEENTLLSAPCHAIVGVSGGADSMALLHCLCSLQIDGLTLTAVHVHHGLRGETADRDAAFVQAKCGSLGVPVQVVYADVPTLAAQMGCGVEEAGRKERYRIFEEIRAQRQADYILTAHNADDQTETVLMHILRGCGTEGLCGIPAARGYIRRPLLCCTRQEIEAYCTENGVPYITDETNADPGYTRNRVRHQVLPLLRQVYPSADAALRRLSMRASEDSRLLGEMAADALRQALLPDGGYDTACFVRQPLPIRRRMLRGLLREWEISSIEEKHILDCEAAVLQGGGRVLLPDGLQLVVGQGRLLVLRETPVKPADFAISALPCAFSWGEDSVRLWACDADENVHKMFLQYTIDYGKIQGDLYVRTRREGDVLHPAGRGIGKSLKKLMNEWRIPAVLRDSFPLLCDAGGVVLVPGYTCDERVRVTEATKHFLVWQTNGEQG